MVIRRITLFLYSDCILLCLHLIALHLQYLFVLCKNAPHSVPYVHLHRTHVKACSSDLTIPSFPSDTRSFLPFPTLYINSVGLYGHVFCLSAAAPTSDTSSPPLSQGVNIWARSFIWSMWGTQGLWISTTIKTHSLHSVLEAPCLPLKQAVLKSQRKKQKQRALYRPTRPINTFLQKANLFQSRLINFALQMTNIRHNCLFFLCVYPFIFLTLYYKNVM